MSMVPFMTEKTFWERLARSGALNIPNLILGRDLNLTLNNNEDCCKNARSDALAPFFTHLFKLKNLIDLAPIKHMPTWRNRRSGDQAVSKRLDRFLVSDSLIGSDLILKATVETKGISDHFPIVLTIENPEFKPPVPFKFKPQWLEEEEYRNLIQEA